MYLIQNYKIRENTTKKQRHKRRQSSISELIELNDIDNKNNNSDDPDDDEIDINNDINNPLWECIGNEIDSCGHIIGNKAIYSINKYGC